MMEKKKTHWPSVAMLILSGGGTLLSLGTAAALFILGLFFLYKSPDSTEQGYICISAAWAAGLVGVLVLPAALFSLFRLLDRPFHMPVLPRWVNGNTALILWPFVIGAGYLLSRLTGLTWLFLPPLQLLAVGIPIWWLLSFSSRGLETGPGERRWKVFSFSLLVTNPVVITVELIILTVALVAGVVWFMQQPDLIEMLRQTGQEIANSNMDPAMLDQIVKDILSNPIFLLSIFAAVCILAPLIEEPLKSLGVWFLYKKNLTPAQGLFAGALCGAAFTLVESLGTINRPFDGETWVAVLVGRTGTAVMHILTSSLTGWGVGSLAESKKFGHAFLAYLAAMSLHGLWNFFSVVSGFYPYFDLSKPGYALLNGVGNLGIYLIVILASLYLLGIFLINRKMKAAVFDVK